MKKCLLVIPFFIFLFGCNETIKGEFDLKVDTNLAAYVQVGTDWGEDEVWEWRFYTVPAGFYEKARLIFSSSKKAALKLPGFEPFEINLKNGARFPDEPGSFIFEASQNNQNMNMSGSVSESSRDSEEMNGTEYCDLWEWRTICDSNGNCHTQRVSVRGNRDIRYYNEIITKEVEVRILGENFEEILGTFWGEKRSFIKHVTSYGVCRRW